MCTFGSSAIRQELVGGVAGDHAVRAPVVGQPDLVHDRGPARQRHIRSVTTTRASIAVRAVMTVAQPHVLQARARRPAPGEISQNISGCSSER